MEYTAEEQKEYEKGLAEGYSPASMQAGIEKRRMRKEQPVRQEPARQEPTRQEPVRETPAPQSGGGNSKWTKIGAGIGKVGAGIHKFLFTPGGKGKKDTKGYDEDPIRFKNSGKYKHQPKVVYVREQPKKKTQKIVYVREREAPRSPFASDFSGGGGFSSGRTEKRKGITNPFASDLSGGSGFSPRREEVEYRTDRKGKLLNSIGRTPKEIRERNVSPFESDIKHAPGLLRKRKR